MAENRPGPAQGPAGGPADLPVVSRKSDENGADCLGPVAGNCGRYLMHAGYSRYREVLGLRDYESGLARPRGGREALRALLRERCAGGRTGGLVGVTAPPALLSHESAEHEFIPVIGIDLFTPSLRSYS